MCGRVDLKPTAQELQSCVAEKLGTTLFAAVYSQVKSEALDRRRARKGKRAILVYSFSFFLFLLSFVNRGWWVVGLTFLCRLLQIRKELPRKRLKSMRGRGRLGRRRERRRGRGGGGEAVRFLSLGGGCILVFFHRGRYVLYKSIVFMMFS